MAIPELQDVPVLVTGGAGFIGSHLVDELVRRGARVRVLDNLATGLRENLAHLKERIELHEEDLRDAEACRRAAAGVELVYHQAALGSVPRSMKDPATSFAVNVTGTANIFAAARDGGARRVVYASSSSVYGDHPELPKREGHEGACLSPYATSKSMCEQLADIFLRSYGLEIIGLRYFNVYGPRQRPDGPYAAVIPRFFDAYRQGTAPSIHGDGEQSRDFTFVADAVRANLLASGAPAAAAGRAFNVAAGKRSTLNELVQIVRDLMGGGPPPNHTDPRPGDVRHSLADLSAIREATGYEPRYDLAAGLAKTAASYRSEGAGEGAGEGTSSVRVSP